MVDEFLIIFYAAFWRIFSLQSWHRESVWIFGVDDSLIWTLSLCFVCVTFTIWSVVCNVCACLRWLNRISFASVNCHNWSKNNKNNNISVRYFSLCLFANGESWFFLRRPHRKLYAVIIYILDTHIVYEIFFSSSCIARIFLFACYSVIFLNCRQI